MRASTNQWVKRNDSAKLHYNVTVRPRYKQGVEDHIMRCTTRCFCLIACMRPLSNHIFALACRLASPGGRTLARTTPSWFTTASNVPSWAYSCQRVSIAAAFSIHRSIGRLQVQCRSHVPTLPLETSSVSSISHHPTDVENAQILPRIVTSHHSQIRF